MKVFIFLFDFENPEITLFFSFWTILHLFVLFGQNLQVTALIYKSPTFGFEVRLLCPGGRPDGLALLRVVEQPRPVQLRDGLLHLLLHHHQPAVLSVTSTEKMFFLLSFWETLLLLH